MNTKTKNKPITPKMEDYLEAIVALEKEKKAVRVKDIASKMGVSMPTVTSMLKNLSKIDLVEYEKYEYIELTDKGREIGKEIQRRHRALKKFLHEILGIDAIVAESEACKMEHAVSTSTLDRFVDFMNFIKSCPRAGSKWIGYFHEYLKHGKSKATCEKYREYLDDIYNKIRSEIGRE